MGNGQWAIDNEQLAIGNMQLVINNSRVCHLELVEGQNKFYKTCFNNKAGFFMWFCKFLISVRWVFLFLPINNIFVGWNGKIIIMHLKELRNTWNA
jgi:hypothetical protein